MEGDALKYDAHELVVKKVGGEPRVTVFETHNLQCNPYKETGESVFEYTRDTEVESANMKDYDGDSINSYLNQRGIFFIPEEPQVEVAADGVVEEEEEAKDTHDEL